MIYLHHDGRLSKNEFMKNRRFATYAWGVLAYNVLVILWGAYVRATGSGAGCGRHWPLCNGVVVPRAPQMETLIEYTHRASSGLAGVLVIILLVWAWRRFPRDHAVRRAAALSLLFIVTEGLVGAALVLREWVAYDDSVERAVIMAVHLTNTFLLLGALTMTGWWATTLSAADTGKRLHFHKKGAKSGLLGIALLLITVVSAAGAVTALGDTLFPAGTLSEGVARDFSPTAHFLERLRIWHPILAVFSALYIFTVLGLLLEENPTAHVKGLTRLAQLLVAGQIAAGVVNLLLLAPVAMQLLHLFLADAIWISLVLLSVATLEGKEQVKDREALAIEGGAPSGATD